MNQIKTRFVQTWTKWTSVYRKLLDKFANNNLKQYINNF